MKVIDKVYVAEEAKVTVRDLSGTIMRHVNRTFVGWPVAKDKKAYFVFEQGLLDDDDCRPVEACDAVGMQLPVVLRRFAEIVVDGLYPDIRSLEVTIENEDAAGGLHIAVVECDNTEGCYKWMLHELPQMGGHDWGKFGESEEELMK